MKTTPTLCSLLLATSLASQNPSTLFNASRTVPTQMGSGSPLLGDLDASRIGLLPSAGGSARPALTVAAAQTMSGDTNGDGVVAEPDSRWGINALLVKGGSSSGNPDARNIYFSPTVDRRRAVSGGRGLRRGDVGRIVRRAVGDGRIEYFLRLEQIQSAFGISSAVDVDLDAIAQDGAGNLYLSLADDTPIEMIEAGIVYAATLRRDAVALLPFSGLTYDGRGNVRSIVAGCGRILLEPAAVDGLAAASGIADHTGACVTDVLNVDALEVDPTGGSFQAQVLGGTVTASHLVIGGQGLTGMGAISTQGGGQIYALPGGTAFGVPCSVGPTLGDHLGLQPPSGGGGLDAHLHCLAFASTDMDTFVMEVSARDVAISGAFDIELSGGSAGGVAFLFGDLYPSVTPLVAPSAVSPFCLGFPDIYLPSTTAVSLGPIALDGDGFGTKSMSVPFAAQALFQAVQVAGPACLHLSAPASVDVR